MYVLNSASEQCVFIFYCFRFVLEHRKCLNFVENWCVIFWLYLRVFYPSVSVDRLVHRYNIHRSPSRTDGNRCFSVPSPNPSRLYSTHFFWMSFLSFWEFSCFLTAEWIVRTKTSARMFCDVAQIQLIRWIYSLISGIIPLKMTIVRIPVSGSNVSVSVSVLNSIFHLWASIRI